MRKAEVNRKTSETDIKLSINLDGSGKSEINTGIGFFDHMLTGFAKHGFFDLNLKISGDLQVDGHHSVEDAGIVLGNALKEAVGDKKGMNRFGYFILPMDDALMLCAIDFCGRPYLNYEVEFHESNCGYFENALIKEFFYAVSYSAGMNIHFKMLAGDNSHHIAESMFKAFGKALDMATKTDSRINDVLSTKGKLK